MAQSYCSLQKVVQTLSLITDTRKVEKRYCLLIYFFAGVLLYGPPGCGKTLIAKATAKAAGARFINLQLSSLVDKWYGESQKRAEAVFSLVSS